MAFFLIVPSVMIVSVLLIHALANRMGLRIYYGTLIAVAIVAFAVDFAAVLISPAAGKSFFLRLGIFVLAASFLLTVANGFFDKRKRAEEKNFNEEVRAAYQAEVEKTSAKANAEPVTEIDVEPAVETSPEPLAPLEKFEWGGDETSRDGNFSASTDEPAAQEPKPTLYQKVEAEENSSDEDREPAQYNEVSNSTEKSEPTEEFPLDEVFKPLESLKIETLEKIAREEQKSKPEPSPKPDEVFPYEEVFKPLDAVKPETLEKIQEDEHVTPHEPAPEVEEKIETLDDILDRAYAERAKGHVWQAIDFYRRALERYRNDEYAPFIAIDLGNVFKEEALYSKAIKIYEEALTLPTVVRNAATRKEFIKNLEYLRAVRTILLRHRALSTPFSKIPKEMLREIDAEIRKTQLHGK